MLIDDEYNRLLNEKSDINEHLSILREISSNCNHVTEMGFRTGVSCVAMLAGRPREMVSYDIMDNWMGIRYQDKVAEMVPDETNWTFIQADTTNTHIVETDFLFIDTLHTYRQLKIELNLHSMMVRKYIGFHDVVTFGRSGEDGSQRGLMDAIDEFLNPVRNSFNGMISPGSVIKNVNREWNILTYRENNNGLLILERV